MASLFFVCFVDDVPEWERELQAELQEYEVVDDGNNIDDADLEREIMSQIEAESKQSWKINWLKTWQSLTDWGIVFVYTYLK